MEADGAIRTAVCKVLTLNSWALSVTVSIIFELESRIWSQNYLNFSIFSMDALCGGIFWSVLSNVESEQLYLSSDKLNQDCPFPCADAICCMVFLLEKHSNIYGREFNTPFCVE